MTPKLRLPPKDFYPRSPCGERRQRDLFQFPDTGISIHALLAESDPVLLFPQIPVFDFYPRSPCGERPYILPFVAHLLFQFLSTLSLRRATYADNLHHNTLLKFLSTLSLRRATDLFAISARARLISIHALLAESDHLPASFHPMSLDFYPRSPCGERRRGAANCYLDNIISIHALLAESDAAIG